MKPIGNERMDTVKEQWKRMLWIMLTDYREKHPEDKTPIHILAEDLMDYFCDNGLINKTADGKYLIPEIMNDEIPEHMLRKIMLQLANQQLYEEVIGHVDIYHDDGCDFLANKGPCKCNPDIKFDAPGKN